MSCRPSSIGQRPGSMGKRPSSVGSCRSGWSSRGHHKQGSKGLGRSPIHVCFNAKATSFEKPFLKKTFSITRRFCVKANMDGGTVMHEFVLTALRESQMRVDGRHLQKQRKLQLTFATNYVTAHIGKTKVMAVVSHEMTKPYIDKPAQGFLTFQAHAKMNMTTDKELEDRLTIMLERSIKESRALDVECLCVLSGEKVWSLRVDVIVLDNFGNVLDAASIASITALHYYRLPSVNVTGSKVIVHSVEAVAPVKLPMLHMPICCTIGLIADPNPESNTIYNILDPSLTEELVLTSTITFCTNKDGHLCAIEKNGGVPLKVEEVMELFSQARKQVEEVTKIIRKELIRVEKNDRERRDMLLSKKYQVPMDFFDPIPMLPRKSPQKQGKITVVPEDDTGIDTQPNEQL